MPLGAIGAIVGILAGGASIYNAFRSGSKDDGLKEMDRRNQQSYVNAMLDRKYGVATTYTESNRDEIESKAREDFDRYQKGKK